MTLEELQEYPNVLDALRTYYKNKLEESIEQTKDVPDDFKEMLRDHGADHIDNTIIGVINLNPRMLFDFFDDQSLFINITTEKGETFSYTIIINHQTGVSSTLMAKTRKEAEKEAIITATVMLETRLTKSVSDKENS